MDTYSCCRFFKWLMCAGLIAAIELSCRSLRGENKQKLDTEMRLTATEHCRDTYKTSVHAGKSLGMSASDRLLQSTSVPRHEHLAGHATDDSPDIIFKADNSTMNKHLTVDGNRLVDIIFVD